MNILILLLIPALYALANTVDKFLVHGDGIDSEAGPLMAISGLFSLGIAGLVAGWMVLHGISINLISLFPLIANGGLYIGAIWLYFAVLRREETSRAVPWFQTIPLFGIFLAFITLKEIPSKMVVVGIILLMIGGFLLSVKNGVVKHRMMVLMLASSGMIALYDVIFAKFGREMDDSAAILGSLLGHSFWGLIILVGKHERRGFILGLQTKFKIQATGEVITIVSNALIAFAKLHMPIAVVQAGCATQPIFVLLFALVFAKCFPKVFSDELTSGSVWKKAFSIAIITVGGSILAVTTSSQ